MLRRSALVRAEPALEAGRGHRLVDAATLVEPKSMIFTVPVLCAGPVDHDVLGSQVLLQHLLAVEGLQAGRDLLDDASHRLEGGAEGSIIHCIWPSTYSLTITAAIPNHSL
jgi:hypothetical protein